MHCTYLIAPFHGLFYPDFINVEPLRLKDLAKISRIPGQLAVHMNDRHTLKKSRRTTLYDNY